MSIGIHDAIDAGVKAVYTVASDLFLSAAVFPEVFEMNAAMKRAEGGPGSLGAGGAKWVEGANALQEAQLNLQQAVGTLTAEQWSGDDRDAFDTLVQQLGAQLGDEMAFSATVGGTLIALALPFSLFPPVCVACAGIMAVFAAAFEAAAASVVGDLGVSESIYAAGQEAAVTCLEVINTSVEIITAFVQVAAVMFVISDVAEIAALKRDGDSEVGVDFVKAEVFGLQDIAIDKLVEKIGAGDKASGEFGLGRSFRDQFAKELIKTGVDGEVKKHIDEPVRDLEDGRPLDALVDALKPPNPIPFVPDDELEKLPENLGELINEGVDYKKHG